MINEAESEILENNKHTKVKGQNFTLLGIKRKKNEVSKNEYHEHTSSHFRQDHLHHDSSIFNKKNVINANA